MLTSDIHIKTLEPLVGTWIGKGIAIYPGFDTCPYDEIWTLQADEDGKLLQYEQKSRRSHNQALLFWEFGFIRPLSENTIDLVNSQKSGRVEVMTGQIVTLENDIEIHLVTQTFGNDPRMISAQRHIQLLGDELRYTVTIATTAAPQAFEHLTAHLKRYS